MTEDLANSQIQKDAVSPINNEVNFEKFTQPNQSTWGGFKQDKYKVLNSNNDVLNYSCGDHLLENQLLNIDDSILHFTWNSIWYELRTKLTRKNKLDFENEFTNIYIDPDEDLNWKILP